MAGHSKDLAALNQGVAALATCIIQEIAKSDPRFELGILQRLNEARLELCDKGCEEGSPALALLDLTRTMITGTVGEGRPRPFLSERLDD
jgi:hypothetical protein